MTSLGKVIARYRQESGKTLRVVGEESGVTYVTVHHIETGLRCGSPRAVRAIGKALSIPCAVLRMAYKDTAHQKAQEAAERKLHLFDALVAQELSTTQQVEEG
jgi:hypothetical protein